MQKETNQYKHLFVVAGGWINNRIKTTRLIVMTSWQSHLCSLLHGSVSCSLVPPWCNLGLLPRDHFWSFLIFPQPDSECCIIACEHILHLFLWSENLCCLSFHWLRNTVHALKRESCSRPLHCLSFSLLTLV